MNWTSIFLTSHLYYDGWREEKTTPLYFISSEVLDITTYEYEHMEFIGRKVLDVAEAITNRTTFDYIKTDELWYLVACNMPFIADRIDWGTSIRGAWWSCDKVMKLSTCGLLDQDGKEKTDWEFTLEEWNEFILACVEYSRVPWGEMR